MTIENPSTCSQKRAVVRFGGASCKLGKSPPGYRHPHDFIKHSIKTKGRKLDEFKALYEQGLSLRAIAQRTGYSKTKVRTHLQRAGVAVRDFSKSHPRTDLLAKFMYSGAIPYGYAYLEGKLVVDPREYQIIHEIYRKWQNGMSYRAITRELNDRKVPTRFGKKWNHEVVRKIIKRHENKISTDNGQI